MGAGFRFAPLILHGKQHMATPLRFGDLFIISLTSLSELVKDGENGLVFKNAGELASQLEVGCKKSFWKLLTHWRVDATHVVPKRRFVGETAFLAPVSIAKSCITASSAQGEPQLGMGDLDEQLESRCETSGADGRRTVRISEIGT